ncbi:MAG: DUF721 domain-containing protein, partial [Actinobacteria bacterium]
MTKRKGKGLSLADALEVLSHRLDRSSGGKWGTARVESIWPSVVGPQIAAHTGGVHLRGGQLVVLVDSATWASELTTMSELLRGRVNDALGKEAVSSIQFTVSRHVVQQRQREQEAEATRGHDKSA